MYRTSESTSHVLLPWFHDYYAWVETAKMDILFNLAQTQIPNDIHKICTSVFSFPNNTHSMRNRQIIAFVAWAWLPRRFYSITIRRKCPVKTSLSDSRAETAGLTHSWAPPGNRPCPAGTVGAAPRVVRRCSPSPQTQAAGDKEPYRTVPQTCGWAPQSPREVRMTLRREWYASPSNTRLRSHGMTAFCQSYNCGKLLTVMCLCTETQCCSYK